MKKLLHLAAAFAALVVLSGCQTPVGQALGPVWEGVKDGGERIYDSFELDVTESGAAVEGLGFEAGVSWKAWGCILVGKVVPSLCEDEPAEE